jgi:hypothetical protein
MHAMMQAILHDLALVDVPFHVLNEYTRIFLNLNHFNFAHTLILFNLIKEEIHIKTRSIHYIKTIFHTLYGRR